MFFEQLNVCVSYYALSLTTRRSGFFIYQQSLISDTKTSCLYRLLKEFVFIRTLLLDMVNLRISIHYTGSANYHRDLLGRFSRFLMFRLLAVSFQVHGFVQGTCQRLISISASLSASFCLLALQTKVNFTVNLKCK